MSKKIVINIFYKENYNLFQLFLLDNGDEQVLNKYKQFKLKMFKYINKYIFIQNIL